jgi:hypothetical protein
MNINIPMAPKCAHTEKIKTDVGIPNAMMNDVVTIIDKSNPRISHTRGHNRPVRISPHTSPKRERGRVKARGPSAATAH